ncbi:MAG: TonB family protein [Vicinamibacteria bacterium]|nr:TonB family protein [Vicinamibacteria bacterium]
MILLIRLVAPGLAAALALGQASAPAEKPFMTAGKDVPAPKLERSIAPDMPPAAEARGVGGIVIVAVLIDEQGRVASAEIVRGIPGLDESALKAVRQWRFTVTRVDDKPVRVRHVVPVSFAHRLPRVTRADDVPELRQGVVPRFPEAETDTGERLVALTLLVDENGHVTAIGVESGAPPWTDAALAAVKTWRFASEAGRSACALRLEARFLPETRSAGLRLIRMAAEARPADSSMKIDNDATVTPTGAERTASPAITENAPSESPVESEIISSAVPLPSSTPPPAGVSAVESVVLGPGVPDLILGRRPVVPPIARLDHQSGAIKVVFSVDADGHTTVHQVDGPDVLRAAAEGVVRSWTFRLLTSERIFLVATIAYDAESATAMATVGRRDLGL